MTLTLANLWTLSANREAARIRAPRIDVEHLYLGLLQTGGNAARLLGERGISLASARRLVLASTGGQADLGALPAATLPVTPEAQGLIEHALKAPGTSSLLLRLLEHPTGPVRALVESGGLRPAQLIPALDLGAIDPFVPAVTHGATPQLGTSARAHRLSWYVSASTSTVVHALRQPASLDWWAYPPARATRDEGSTVIRHRRRGTDLSVRLTLSDRREGESWIITWESAMVEGLHAGRPVTQDHFDIVRAPGGCHITRTAGRRPFGLVGRSLAPLMDQVHARTLMLAAAAITYGIIDRV